MTDNRTLRWFLFAYLALVFVFIFAPIFFSVVFSFNSDRFPTIPLGNFTLKWYQTVWNDPVTLVKEGRIHYRNIPVQQTLEDWNDFWSEYKNA